MSASAYPPDEPNRRALYTFGSAHFLNDLVTAGLVPALVVMYKGALHLNYILNFRRPMFPRNETTEPIFGNWRRA